MQYQDRKLPLASDPYRIRKEVRKQDRRCKCNLVGGYDLDVNVAEETGRASGSCGDLHPNTICPAVVEESRGTTSASKLLGYSAELLCRRKCRWLRLVWPGKERNGRRKSFLKCFIASVYFAGEVRNSRTQLLLKHTSDTRFVNNRSTRWTLVLYRGVRWSAQLSLWGFYNNFSSSVRQSRESCDNWAIRRPVCGRSHHKLDSRKFMVG